MKHCKFLCNDYAILFDKHKVYCDEPGDPCNINNVKDAEKYVFLDGTFNETSPAKVEPPKNETAVKPDK